MTATLIRGDARHLPVPDASIDLVVTSPPYFLLRTYDDGGKPVAGQIGAEDSPTAYLDAMLEATAEWCRVLTDEGTLWVNLGDTYASFRGPNGNAGQRGLMAGRPDPVRPATPRGSLTEWGVKRKSLMGMPWRYALRCMDELGLVLRSEVVWDKTNSVPTSADDRPRRTHEQWFMFAKRPDYYSAFDLVREAHSDTTMSRARYSTDKAMNGRMRSTPGEKRVRANPWVPSELGALPTSVRRIPPGTFTGPDHIEARHFATFPVEWPRWIITASCPVEVCLKCQCGRRPVIEVSEEYRAWRRTMGDFNAARRADDGSYEGGVARAQAASSVPDAKRRLTGWECDCPDTTGETRPGRVLDPFSGTGTTALVADVLGRDGIGVELSDTYHDIARWRITDPKQRALALGVAPPPPVSADQGALW